MPKGFFITGTDTGVGKTFAAGIVIRALSLLGLRTGAMKPVESGCVRKGGELVPSDGRFLKEMAEMDDPLGTITPCRFENPLAPFIAAEIESAEVGIKEITAAFARLGSKYDALVVEGIGGLMVPLKQDYFVSDLAAEFRLPLIIVARPGLGTINHTLLTIDHAIRAGLEIAGIILNYTGPPENTIAERTNQEVLSRTSPVQVIGKLPFMAEISRETAERTAIKSLDLAMLKKYL